MRVFPLELYLIAYSYTLSCIYSSYREYNLPVFPRNPLKEHQQKLYHNIPKVVYRAVPNNYSNLDNIIKFTYLNNDWEHKVYDNVRYILFYYTTFFKVCNTKRKYTHIFLLRTLKMSL